MKVPATSLSSLIFAISFNSVCDSAGGDVTCQKGEIGSGVEEGKEPLSCSGLLLS